MKTVIFTLQGAILDNGEHDTTLHYGVDELLPIFHRLGVRVIAFAPGGHEAIAELERLGAHKHFHYIASDESLQQLIAAVQPLPHEVVVVGDRVADILLGKNAGATRVVGVSHGQATSEALRAAGADHVIHDLPALLDILG